MSAPCKTVTKKVTKIIRKDGIIYRPAGGTTQSSQKLESTSSTNSVTPSQSTASNKNTVPSSQGNKKTIGKVIKRADGTKIVVVDGKIVKTLKKNDEEIPKPPLKLNKNNMTSQEEKSGYDEALSPLTDISADELPPEIPDAASDKSENKPIANPDVCGPVLSIKRTITFDQRRSPALLEKPLSPKERRQFAPRLSKSFNVSKESDNRRNYKDSNSSRKQSYTSRSHNESHGNQKDQVGTHRHKSDNLETKRSETRDYASHNSKKFRRSRSNSPRQARPRSPDHRGRAPQHSRVSGKYRQQKTLRSRDRSQSRSRSPKARSFDKRSISPRKQSLESKSSQIVENSLTSLLINEESNSSTHHSILNLIQQQAEDLLQAQHRGPIDEEKKKKLRDAMQSILEKRGLITPSQSRKRKKSLLRSTSSEESSDGRESPKILEKLHQKYNSTAKEVSPVSENKKESLNMEAISPCIDNISVASEGQKVSDVSQSDMELSDEDAQKDNEDGKTPAYRRKTIITDDNIKEPSSQLIQIKLGKDEDEEAFQSLAARVDGLRSSADVQDLIQAIESRIKSYLTDNISPAVLENKIKRYQALVAKVVIEAESIKEKEEDSKITYHTQRSGSKELRGPQSDVKGTNTFDSISYPVQNREQRQPWLFSNVTSQNTSTQNNSQQSLSQEMPGSAAATEFEKIHAQYVSQRIGYHVCLLCMIESSNDSHFQKHLDSKKHHEAVCTKIRQLQQSNSANVKKFKRHDLVTKCKLCDVICRGEKKYNEHANHRSHLAQVQAYIKIGRAIPEPEILHDHEHQIRGQIEEIQESDTPAVGREFMSVKTVKDCDDNVKDVYFCSLCKTNCNSEIQVEKHVRSKKHYLIYVKVTQPEVNVQVNAGEHKKRRETTKKIFTAMKTIKQMEEMIERNRDRIGNDSSVVVNDNQHSSQTQQSLLKGTDFHNSYNKAQVASFSASNYGQMQSGSGSNRNTYQNHSMDMENMSSQNAPYYRDPTTRLSVKENFSGEPNTNSQLYSGRFNSTPAPLLHNLPMSYSKEDNQDSMFHSHKVHSQSGLLSSTLDHGGQNRFIRNEECSTDNNYRGSAHNFQDSSKQDSPIKSNNPGGRYSVSYSTSVPSNSLSNPVSGHHGSSNFESHGGNAFQASFHDQSNQFKTHQEFLPRSHQQNTSVYGKQPFNELSYGGSNCSSQDNDHLHLAENNFQSSEAWQNTEKRSTITSNRVYNDQSSQFINPSLSSSSRYNSHSSNYPKHPPVQKSWENKSIQETKSPASDAFAPPSYTQPQNSFNNAGPSGQSYLETARNTYNSAYNLLKQAESQSTPQAISYSGPTFSGKPTYKGVYTNVRR